MRALPFVLLLAACASNPKPTTATTTTSAQASPPGPPPPSRSWTGEFKTVGDYSVYPRALEVEDSDLGIDLAIRGRGVKRLVASAVKAGIVIAGKVTWCTGSGRIEVVDFQGLADASPTGVSLHRCEVSVTGKADLVVEIEGTRTAFSMNLR